MMTFLQKGQSQRNLWLEPASWRKISARKRAKNSEFVGGIRRESWDALRASRILASKNR